MVKITMDYKYAFQRDMRHVYIGAPGKTHESSQNGFQSKNCLSCSQAMLAVE